MVELWKELHMFYKNITNTLNVDEKSLKFFIRNFYVEFLLITFWAVKNQKVHFLVFGVLFSAVIAGYIIISKYAA